MREIHLNATPLDSGLSISNGFGGGSIPLLGTTDYATYSAIYRTNPWVFAAIRSLAWGLSRCMIGVYRFADNGDRIRVRYDRPSNDIAGKELDRKLNGAAGRIGPQRRMRRTAVDFFIYGDALWEDRPDGFYHVPWKSVDVVVDDLGIIGYKVKNTRGTARYLSPENVIHFSAGDDPDSHLGVSSISALKYTLQLYEALQRHMVRFFENSARPSGNLKLHPNANKETMQWMREQFRQLYTSPENAGKVIITTGDFQPITQSADQSQLIELVKLSREEIAAVYRIPMPVLGVLDNAIKSNVQELREQNIRDAIGGFAPAFEDDIRSQAIAPMAIYDGLYAEFDLDAHLRPDLESMADIFVKMNATMTVNERRAWMNLPRLDFPEADTVATTPGAAYLGVTKADGSALGEGEDPESATAEEEEMESVQSNRVGLEQANVIGALIRSGFEPADVIRAAGAPPMEHLGLVPVTLKDLRQIDAEASAAEEAVGEDPPTDPDEPPVDPEAEAEASSEDEPETPEDDAVQ
jgi:HK97 family phage portal protein